MSRRPGLPDGVGLWGGFLDRMPAAAAVAAARDIEAAGIGTVWLQEFSGVDPFVRAALYLQSTRRMTIALGVATIHARDAEGMVSAASTLEEAFPGRFVLGLGVSHRQLAEVRGAAYDRPLEMMRTYLSAMEGVAGRRRLPARFLGALGPLMVALAAESTDGVHTYFCPVAHTAATRAAIGPAPWIAPTQLVATGAPGADWHAHVRPYLGLCLGMPNYRRNLRRFGFGDRDLDTASGAVIDALVVPDTRAQIAARLADHRAAGADHVVVQLVPPPPASVVLERVVGGILSSVAEQP